MQCPPQELLLLKLSGFEEAHMCTPLCKRLMAREMYHGFCAGGYVEELALRQSATMEAHASQARTVVGNFRPRFCELGVRGGYTIAEERDRALFLPFRCGPSPPRLLVRAFKVSLFLSSRSVFFCLFFGCESCVSSTYSYDFPWFTQHRHRFRDN